MTDLAKSGSMKVLLVEDTVGVPILKVLQKMGYEVLLAENAEEAWEMLEETRIDLFLIDWMLPGVSGLGLVRRIRLRPDYTATPIIMISGRSGRGDIATAIEAGISSYIVKPFTAVQLRDKIIEVLQSAEKNPRREELHALCQGQADFRRESGRPVVLAVESANTPEALVQPHREAAAAFLLRLGGALEEINADRAGGKVGYRLEYQTQHVIDRLKKRVDRERIRLVLVAADAGGNSYLLMRLLKVNRRGIRAVLVCDEYGQVPQAQMAQLEALDVDIRLRRELGVDELRRLVEEAAGTAAAVPAAAGDVIGDALEGYLERADALPAAPAVYERISRLAADPGSDIAEWGRAVVADPMVSALVVRRARAPVYGFQEDVAEAERAVVLLGKNAVEQLVMTQATRRAFNRVEVPTFSLNAFWLHSLAVGCAARLLSFPLDEGQWTPVQRREFETFGLADADRDRLRAIDLPGRLKLADERLPFCAGLMHDIGKVVLVQAYPEAFPLILEKMRAAAWSYPMRTAEEEATGGLTHESAGEILVRKWDLGDRLARVVGEHHAPKAGDPCAFLVGVADLCGHLVHPFPQEAEYPLHEALRGGSMTRIRPFLPDDFAAQSFLSEEELVELLRVAFPCLRELVAGLRATLGVEGA